MEAISYQLSAISHTEITANGAHDAGLSSRQRKRREVCWRVAALMLFGLVGSIGCDPISTIGFLAQPFAPNNDDAVYPLTVAGKESKVVFICGHEGKLPINDTFREADIFICRQLTTLLAQQYKENKDKITIVPVSQVYQYLREHQEWGTLSKHDVGKHFNADYVVYIELGPMTLYEPGSNGTLYRGGAELRMLVFDVHETEGEDMKPEKFKSWTYPASHPEDAGSMRPDNFRTMFLEKIAKDLVPYFANHPVVSRMDSMDDDQ